MRMSSSFLESTQQSLPQIPKDLLKLVRAAKACHQPAALSQAGGWIWSPCLPDPCSEAGHRVQPFLLLPQPGSGFLRTSEGCPQSSECPLPSSYPFSHSHDDPHTLSTSCFSLSNPADNKQTSRCSVPGAHSKAHPPRPKLPQVSLMLAPILKQEERNKLPGAIQKVQLGEAGR